MAVSLSERMNLPPGVLVYPKGREIIEHYLVPKASRGDIVRAWVVDGVDVFSVSPDALPFINPSQGTEDEVVVCGYFFADHPAGEITLAPGGCWFRYGPEKEYRVGDGGEALAFRRRFVFHVPWPGADDGEEIWARTRWQMKEYRLNKGAAAFCDAQHDPRANMDCVIRKLFTKPVVPPPPLSLPSSSGYSSDQENTAPSHSSMSEEARGYSGEDQPRKRARFS